MKRRRYILLTILALLLVVPLILMTWPEGPLDLSKDEEPFRSMVLPPKEVIGVFYMDGGSAAMRLIDKNRIEYWITFPIDYDGIVNAYPEAYNGNINDPKMALLKDPTRAKALTIRLLREYGKTNDRYGETDTALRVLSTPIRSAPSRLIDRVKREFNIRARDF